MLQEQIDTILNGEGNKKSKIKQLNKLFIKNEIKFFTDMDDTITKDECIFYTKLKFLTKIKRKPLTYACEEIIKDLQIREDFFEEIEKYSPNKICIISRNEHEFVKVLTNNVKEIFSEKGIEVVGGIGRIKEKFEIKSLDKLPIMPPASTIISDIFEYWNFKDYIGYICIDKKTPFELIKKISIKVFYLGKYIYKKTFKFKKKRKNEHNKSIGIHKKWNIFKKSRRK